MAAHRTRATIQFSTDPLAEMQPNSMDVDTFSSL